jgi:hypothetical protein
MRHEPVSIEESFMPEPRNQLNPPIQTEFLQHPQNPRQAADFIEPIPAGSDMLMVAHAPEPPMPDVPPPSPPPEIPPIDPSPPMPGELPIGDPPPDPGQSPNARLDGRLDGSSDQHNPAVSESRPTADPGVIVEVFADLALSIA